METLAGVLDRLYGNIGRCFGQAVWKHWQVSWVGCMETLAVVLGRLYKTLLQLAGVLGRLYGNIGRCFGQSVWKH